jgi:hypothetical protein
MKLVLYLKYNYDILLIITVPDVAYLKRIKRAKQLYIKGLLTERESVL